MPFDTNVPQPERLSFQSAVAPTPDPLDAATKVLTLRNLSAQGQTQAAQLVGLQQENQMRQLQLNDQQYLSANLPKMYGDPQYQDAQGNVDFAKIARAVAPNVSLGTAQSMYKGVLENQKSVAQITKDRVDTSKTGQEIQANDSDMLAGAAQRWQPDSSGHYNTAAINFDLDQFQRSHPEYAPQIGQLRQHLQDNPDAIGDTINGIVGGAKADRVRANSIAKDADLAYQKFKLMAPGEIADADLKQRAAIASTLSNSRNGLEYQQNLAQLNARANDPSNPSPGSAPQIPFDPQSLFDQQGNWKPGAQAYVRNWGLSDEQQQMAINAANVRKDAEANAASAHSDRVVMQGIAQQNADTNSQRASQSTAAQNAAVDAQFNRAVSENAAGGSTNLADAQRNVEQFYKGDPAMDAVRGDVLAKFDKLLSPGGKSNSGGGDVGALAAFRSKFPGGKGAPAQASSGNAGRAATHGPVTTTPAALPSAADYISNLQKRKKAQ
jgi:hypothetical protein